MKLVDENIKGVELIEEDEIGACCGTAEDVIIIITIKKDEIPLINAERYERWLGEVIRRMQLIEGEGA